MEKIRLTRDLNDLNLPASGKLVALLPKLDMTLNIGGQILKRMEEYKTGKSAKSAQ